MGKVCSVGFIISILVVFAASDKDDGNHHSMQAYDGYGEYHRDSHPDGAAHNDAGDDDDYNDDDYDDDDYDEGGNKWETSDKSYDDHYADHNNNYNNEYDNNYVEDYNDDNKDNGDDHDDDNDNDKDGKTYMSALTKDTDSVVCTMGVQFIRHPSDCGKFYQCANGRSFLISCPAGLHFNVELSICDWPSSVDCDSDYDDSSDSSDDDGDDEDDEDDDEYDNYGDGDHYKDQGYYSETASSGSNRHPSTNSRTKTILASGNNNSNRRWVDTPSNNRVVPRGRHTPTFPVSNRDGIFVTDTGHMYVEGGSTTATNNMTPGKRRTFIPIQPPQSQQGQQHQAPQFVTHYHYSYQPPQPRPRSQQFMSFPRTTSRQRNRSGTRTTTSRSSNNNMHHHQQQRPQQTQIDPSTMSALSKLISSLSTSSSQNSQSFTMPHPHHQYPALPRSPQNSWTVPMTTTRHQQQQQRPISVQEKIVVHHDNSRPIASQPVVFEKKVVLPQMAAVPQHQQPRQLVKHKVVVHGNGGVMGQQTSPMDDHFYYYDETNNDNNNEDIVYFDTYPATEDAATVGVWKDFDSGSSSIGGSNVLQSFVDSSIYSKEKFQSGALFNPQFFGKAFQDLSSKRNLVHHYHHHHNPQQPMEHETTEEIVKYIHHNHKPQPVIEKKVVVHERQPVFEKKVLVHKPEPVFEKQVVLYPSKDGKGDYYAKNAGKHDVGGDDGGLLKTLLLLSPGGLQTILLSKLLDSLQEGGKSSNKEENKKGGGNNLIQFLLLQRLLTPNPNNATVVAPNPNLTPSIVLRNNQVLRADTLQPVNLVDPTTGAIVLPANAAVLPNGQVVNVANGQRLGYANPATGVFVPAVVAVPVATRLARAVDNRPLVVPNSVPANLGGTGGSRQGINLIFLSPLQPTSLPPPLRNDPGGADYLQGTLRQLLGADLARFLSNQPVPRSEPAGINSPAGRRANVCSVIRSEQFVPFDLPIRGGRRLGSTDCDAMGKTLDRMVPTFFENLLPGDLSGAGLLRGNTNIFNDNDVLRQQNNQGQQLPALIPSNGITDINNNANNNLIGSLINPGSRSSSSTVSGSGRVTRRGRSIIDGRQWHSISHHITVRNDSRGCVISVPHIAARC